jgi:hypothetical protein
MHQDLSIRFRSEEFVSSVNEYEGVWAMAEKIACIVTRGTVRDVPGTNLCCLSAVHHSLSLRVRDKGQHLVGRDGEPLSLWIFP